MPKKLRNYPITAIIVFLILLFGGNLQDETHLGRVRVEREIDKRVKALYGL